MSKSKSAYSCLMLLIIMIGVGVLVVEGDICYDVIGYAGCENPTCKQECAAKHPDGNGHCKFFRDRENVDFNIFTSTHVETSDSDKIAPKQKIRIKLRSYWVPLIEDSCKQILDAARTTNAKTMGPVPLPTKKRIYCVLKSPHVHKDARFHFEIRTHQRLIDILHPTAQTIDSLMQLDLPAGVDVEVKL
ncbi:small ribosomal subunit protein uS10c-like [Bidens hawaiensis]|uniref:small ribosomal subunit protein uS10c-like n=1 Tax=Bidens hawaiensis TaxID=980011 RepID=UPI0040491F93